MAALPTLVVEVGGTKTSFQLVDENNGLIASNIVPSQTSVIPAEAGIHVVYHPSKNLDSRLKHSGITPFVMEPSVLKKQIRQVLKKRAITSLTIGMRGVWTPSEKNIWKQTLRGLAPHIHVMSDIELAFHQYFPGGCGIVLNAGTGSIAYGRSPNGKVARAGGLGPLLGDEGSGYWIGRAYLTRHPDKFSWQHLRRIAKSVVPVATIASFAGVALANAAQGHRPARHIINEAVDSLMALAEEVRKKLGMKKAPLVLTGGLFQNQFFRKKFERKLKSLCHSSFRLQNQF